MRPLKSLRTLKKKLHKYAPIICHPPPILDDVSTCLDVKVGIVFDMSPKLLRSCRGTHEERVLVLRLGISGLFFQQILTILNFAEMW